MAGPEVARCPESAGRSSFTPTFDQLCGTFAGPITHHTTRLLKCAPSWGLFANEAVFDARRDTAP
jgi:hypothetical protein